MQQANDSRPSESDARHGADQRRYQHALDGWLSSHMRRQARERRKAERPPAAAPDPGPAASAPTRGRAIQSGSR
jgi:hypothetical protein